MGKYILTYNDYSNCWEILMQKNPGVPEYMTVIPNAGPAQGFAFELVDLLNKHL